MNKQTFIGNLSFDAKAGKINNIDYVSFPVACNSGYGEKKKTEFLDCIKFGASSRLVDILKKGTKVYASGDCWTETFEGKDKRKVRLDTLEILGQRGSVENI